jgi:hypothetical protein
MASCHTDISTLLCLQGAAHNCEAEAGPLDPALLRIYAG